MIWVQPSYKAAEAEACGDGLMRPNSFFAYNNWEAICSIKDLRWALCGSVLIGNFGKLALAALNDR